MGSTAGKASRAVLRFVASVLMVSGLLLLADAGTTLLWQEPISAFTAAREQSQLEVALAKPPRRVVEKKPLKGDAIGRIDIPRIGARHYVIQGTDSKSLRKGPGHYPDTPLPGDRGTVAIAGHRTTHGAPFRKIDKLRKADRVVVDLPYGRFVYRVEKTRIVAPTELSVTRKVAYDRLILTACHPLYSATQRIVVFARFAKREPSTVRR